MRPFHGNICLAISGIEVKEFSTKRQAILPRLHCRNAKSIATAPPNKKKHVFEIMNMIWLNYEKNT